MANILRQLIFAQPPARSRDTQRQFSTEDAIDYSTLEVRQLGDIYEGLLGAHFEKANGRLELRNENGENHRHGIYYTPDWIVQFLVNETLTPLLGKMEQSADIQRALEARSEERQCDNSFALGVLSINLVDPAMGSGHFLVRATEWLAKEIMNHATTQPMTMQIVRQGDRRITREEIVALRGLRRDEKASARLGPPIWSLSHKRLRARLPLDLMLPDQPNRQLLTRRSGGERAARLFR